MRRKFFDVHAATGSPIAKEALDRIGQLYAVEKTINGSPPDWRRQQRQLQSKPIAEALAAWAEQTVRQLSRKSELAQAFRYMRARWTALVRCFDDGRLGARQQPRRARPALRRNAAFIVPLFLKCLETLEADLPACCDTDDLFAQSRQPPVPVADRRYGFGRERPAQPARRGECRP